jgi:hypothetical protein
MFDIGSSSTSSTPASERGISTSIGDLVMGLLRGGQPAATVRFTLR